MFRSQRRQHILESKCCTPSKYCWEASLSPMRTGCNWWLSRNLSSCQVLMNSQCITWSQDLYPKRNRYRTVNMCCYFSINCSEWDNESRNLCHSHRNLYCMFSIPHHYYTYCSHQWVNISHKVHLFYLQNNLDCMLCISRHCYTDCSCCQSVSINHILRLLSGHNTHHYIYCIYRK